MPTTMLGAHQVAAGEGELWKRVQETARSPFEAAFVGGKAADEAEASSLSSLVGADTRRFGRLQTFDPAARSADGNDTADGADEPAEDEEDAERWARPGSRN